MSNRGLPGQHLDRCEIVNLGKEIKEMTQTERWIHWGVAAVLGVGLLAVPSASAQSFSTSRYIPHIAQGAGWSTELHVFNTCSSSARYRILLTSKEEILGMFLFGLYDPGGYTVSRRTNIGGVLGQPINRETQIWVFPNLEPDVNQGYARVLDESGGTSGDATTDGGCVTVDVVYKQHLPGGQIRSTAIPMQRLSKRGSVLRFDNREGCTTGIAILSNGGSVRLEAVDSYGNTLGQVYLGAIRHTSFPLEQDLPVQGRHGTVHIDGEVGVLGLEFCDRKLGQFRLPHPVP